MPTALDRAVLEAVAELAARGALQEKWSDAARRAAAAARGGRAGAADRAHRKWATASPKKLKRLGVRAPTGSDPGVAFPGLTWKLDTVRAAGHAGDGKR